MSYSNSKVESSAVDILRNYFTQRPNATRSTALLETVRHTVMTKDDCGGLIESIISHALIPYNINKIKKDVCKEQGRGNTNIEAVKYFHQKWKSSNPRYSTVLEAQDDSRVCGTCLQIWTGSSLEANCPKCKKALINTGPIGIRKSFVDVECFEII